MTKERFAKTIVRGRGIAERDERKDITASELYNLMCKYDARLKEMDAQSALLSTLADSYYLGLATDVQPKKRAS